LYLFWGAHAVTQARANSPCFLTQEIVHLTTYFKVNVDEVKGTSKGEITSGLGRPQAREIMRPPWAPYFYNMTSKVFIESAIFKMFSENAQNEKENQRQFNQNCLDSYY
jgi:hypothetical protein